MGLLLSTVHNRSLCRVADIADFTMRIEESADLIERHVLALARTIGSLIDRY